MSDNPNPPRPRWLLPAVLVVLVIGVGWYVGTTMRSPGPDTGQPAADNASPIYRDIGGVVVRLDPEAESITVDHEEIPGFMRAMVMDLKVAEPRELQGLAPGDAILFDMVRIQGVYQIVNIRPAEPQSGGAPDAAAGPDDALNVGDHVPDLALVSARGEAFRLHELEPRHKLITFFYARCPIEHFCPAQAQRLAELQQHVAESDADVHLVRLTLDAEHDTTAVLAGYAERVGADPALWTLAGGPDGEAIRRFAHRAGARVARHDDSYEIDHALVALRVDGTRVVDRAYGLEAMQRMVEGM